MQERNSLKSKADGVSARDTVYGLTTAATIWIVACLGVVCGAGTWRLALAGLTLVFVVLVLGRTFERVLHRWLGPRPVEHGAAGRAAK